MNIAELYAAQLQMAADFMRAYLARSTPAQRASRHFDIGYDGYYGEAQHLALLAQGGFNDVEDFNVAVEKTDWWIAFITFDDVMSLLEYGSPESLAIIADLRAAGLYGDEDQRLRGLEFLAICQRHAPKQTQLLTLMRELGLSMPHRWRK
jgi:hypothetical protein